MDDYCPNGKKRFYRFFNLVSERIGFLGVIGTTKRNILITGVLVLAMRLFFYAVFSDSAQAEYQEINKNREVDQEIMDPLNKIKNREKRKKAENNPICADKNIAYKKELDLLRAKQEIIDEKYQELVKGYPIEEMLPAIGRRDNKTAAFLVAIAKKESDWGKYSPKKKGKNCYNYWGYKGNYNLAPSGYSCFDSPEQAVQVVGDKINALINKRVDTPERMVVWKCGSSCAGHDPGSVAKWISDVRGYFYKLNS